MKNQLGVYKPCANNVLRIKCTCITQFCSINSSNRETSFHNGWGIIGLICGEYMLTALISYFHRSNISNMKLIFIIFLLITGTVKGQHTTCMSNQLLIRGDVKNEYRFDIATMDTMKMIPLGDVVITNHKGEVKRTLAGLQGILLKNILQFSEITAESPKQLSEYYLVFTACDGYQVVYSWNELFNSATGNSTYLVVEKDGTSLSSITPADTMTGRRYVQGISTITIKKIN